MNVAKNESTRASPGIPVTHALRAAQGGQAVAVAELFGIVEPEIRRRVARERARGPRVAQTQTTALVHDVFFRLQRQRNAWRDRDHYFAVTTMAVRRLLLDLAKGERRQVLGVASKSGGAAGAVAENLVAHLPDPALVLDLHEAIERLTASNPRWGQVAELRAFGGRNNHEIAALLGVSLRTVEHDWAYVRAWLHRALGR